MTSIDKVIEHIAGGNNPVELTEVDRLLIREGFKVRRTTHTYLYSKPGHRYSVNAHKKVLHPKAVKELRDLLIDIGLIT